MSRTDTPIKAAFWIFVGLYAAQMVLSLTYVFYCYGLLRDVHYFGWGKVPPTSMKGFLWLSDNLEWMATVLSYSSVVVFAVLVYQTATLLDRLGVAQHLGPGMTTGSLFIPFYNFYRPWAGLGEVANTLEVTVTRRNIPFIGIRGANVGTVVLAISIYSFALFEKFIGLYAADMAKRPSGTEAAGIAYLTDASFIFIVETLLTGVLLSVVVWYWTRIMRNYRDAAALPNVDLSTVSSDTQARDILQVATRPAS